MRVTVDRDLCESNAVCVGVADDLFELDADDLAVVTSDPIPAGREDAARQAVTLCPKVALTLHED